MRTLITICARGGSKGIPGKNIRPLNGRPLLHYTVATARAYAARHPGTDLELSTDSDEIRDVAAAAGLRTDYRRPAALGSDTAGKIDVIAGLKRYAEEANGCTYDLVIDLDVTSPLRTVADLDAAREQLLERPAALNIFSVSPANRNPYFNMVEEQPDGRVDLAKRPQTPFLTRQSAPNVYDMNASFYIFRNDFFERGERSSITAHSLAYVVPHVCFDLDHPLDFEIMDFLLRENKLDVELCA